MTFSVEYLLRFWVAAEDRARGGGWRARWRWLVSPSALIDLAAILPALLLLAWTPSTLLRLVRLLRIVRLAKLGRFSKAWSSLTQALASRRYELGVTLLAAMVVALIAATLLYLVEGTVQPERFGSIPRALWWAVVTLTTIGYGDVSPVTPLGKIIAGATALIGVGLVAAPTGIMAAAFSEALHRREDPRTAAAHTPPTRDAASTLHPTIPAEADHLEEPSWASTSERASGSAACG